MPISNQSIAPEIIAEAEHCRGDGFLLYRTKTIRSPTLPIEPLFTGKGIKEYLSYIQVRAKWKIECDDLIETFNLIQEYHELRAKYAEAKYNRYRVIPEQYRTGEPYPQTKEECRKEIKVLKRLIKEAQNGTG